MKPALALSALLILQDAIEVLLLPRRVRRGLRFATLFFSDNLARLVSFGQENPLYRSAGADAGLYGPLSMLLLFSIWAVTLIAAFGVLEWTSQRLKGQPGTASSITEQIYMSGLTFFTLGYGDVVPQSPSARTLSVIQAGTGLGFIAVVIGYLPVLYQFFSCRESHVIQLDGRAGSPPNRNSDAVPCGWMS